MTSVVRRRTAGREVSGSNPGESQVRQNTKDRCMVCSLVWVRMQDNQQQHKEATGGNGDVVLQKNYEDILEG